MKDDRIPFSDHYLEAFLKIGSIDFFPLLHVKIGGVATCNSYDQPRYLFIAITMCIVGEAQSF